MHHLQTINGATYQYDPAAGVVFYPRQRSRSPASIGS